MGMKTMAKAKTKSKTVKKTTTKKTAAKKKPAKKAPAKKTTVKKAIKKAVKKVTSKKTPPKKKAPVKKAVPKKTIAKKTPAKKTVPKKETKKTAIKKTTKKTTEKKPANKTTVKRETVTKTTTKKPMAPKGPPKKSELRDPAPPVAPVIKAKPANKAVKISAVIVPPDYDPEKDTGEFMSPVMLAYFRQLLIKWRSELIRESEQTIKETLQETELQKPDMADRASAETDHALELRTRDRERKLISKINQTLDRIEDGEYGYCEETGEPISVARLIARPNATLSIEAQERHERMEKTQRDD